MKPDYKNWVPKGMVYGLAGGTLAAFLLFLVFCIFNCLAINRNITVFIHFNYLARLNWKRIMECPFICDSSIS